MVKVLIDRLDVDDGLHLTLKTIVNLFIFSILSK